MAAAAWLAWASTRGTGPRPPKSPNPRPPAPIRIMSRRETPESLSRFLVVTAWPPFRGQGYRPDGNEHNSRVSLLRPRPARRAGRGCRGDSDHRCREHHVSVLLG